MIAYREAYLNPDGTCTIGLQPPAAIPLMVYDFLFNLYMTWLFLRPLLQYSSATEFVNETQIERNELRIIAKRTFVASCVCLLVSLANILILSILRHERGLICLTCCTFDVTVNAVTLHFVTSHTAPIRDDAQFIHTYRDTHVSDRDTDIFAIIDEHDTSTKASEHTVHTSDGETRLNETFGYDDMHDEKN
ncbi:unnamed protein product [Umbelopsis sp. WA50703]